MRQSDKRDYAIIVESKSKIQTTLRLSPTLNTRIQRVIIAYKSAALNSKPPLEAPTQTWVYEQTMVKGLQPERELGISA